MIISPEYGPQLDPKDGTIGKLKLVKRWVLAQTDYEVLALKKKYPDEPVVMELGELSVWHGRNGHQTKPTKAEAENFLKSVKANNHPSLYPSDLVVKEAWCYPEHFDFVCFCE